MNIKQITELLKTISANELGGSVIVSEDLTDVVSLGESIFDGSHVDTYVKALVNRIGKTIFVNKLYTGSAPSLLMEKWEFGSVLQKVSMTIPEAEENTSFGLVDGQEYKTDIFHQPTITAKYFNSKVTFEIPMSFTELQLKASFNTVEELHGFINMVETTIHNTLTIKMDSLIMRTINKMIAETVVKTQVNGIVTSETTGTNAVNVLKMFNDRFTKTLTPEVALFDVDFIKFSTYIIGTYKDRISKVSKLFNVENKERFTPTDSLKMVLLSEYDSIVKSYLQADTFNKNLVELTNFDTVPYWQGTGLNYDFTDISKIIVKSESGVVITVPNILGIIFDKDSIGVCNTDKRVTTNYNAKGEFYNNYYKFEAQYYCDLSENFVVFFMA
ncbi:MAG: hypothetical protein ACRC5T_03135 [Cetobacterium sp.]